MNKCFCNNKILICNDLPFIYKISSFSYSISGLHMIFNKEHCIKYIFSYAYFWNSYAFLLVVVSFTSFLSDTFYVGINNSIYYNIDIFVAFITFIYTLFYTILLRNVNNKQSFCFFICILLALKFKLQGAKYLNNKNLNMYYMYHSLWHYILPTIGILVLELNIKYIQSI